MRFLSILLAAAPLFAQLHVTVQTPEGFQPLSPSVQLGATAVGDRIETRFRAFNASSAALPLQTLTVGGAGFSLASPFLPVMLNPGAAYEFTIRFTPAAPGSYSALLTVNTATAFLRASAEWTAVVATVIDGKPVPLPADGLVLDAVAGQETVIPLVLWNNQPNPISVSQLAITGPGFQLRRTPSLPAQLEPDQTIPFEIAVTPPQEGGFSALLTAGLSRRIITVNALLPKLAAPRLATAASVLRNGMQTPVRISFVDPAPIDGTGKLRVTFQGSFPDPAIRFSNGATEAEFRVAKGSREATFDARPDIILQTGTASGTLVLEAITESGAARQTWFFQPGPVVIDSARATRTAQSLEITMAGFDNTRTAGSVNFRFFDRSGNAIGNVITSTLVTEFGSFFRSSDAGGVFLLRAIFPITGDATMVGSVLVEIANSIGRTELPRLGIP